MVFHEITKEAILNALNNPREVDMHLVAAKKRAVFRPSYGYEISPILWRKVAPKLSAGRVQVLPYIVLSSVKSPSWLLPPPAMMSLSILVSPKGHGSGR